ncbi:hypothetical protein H0H93_011794 [Arthromyces matolae]|nr:hypothetical protein H0H93_011794 [Arthromyces matolae]
MPQSNSGNGQGNGQAPSNQASTTSQAAPGSVVAMSGAGTLQTQSQTDTSTSTAKAGSNSSSAHGQSGSAWGTVTVTGAVAGFTSPGGIAGNASQHHSAPVAAIVGGVAGGIVCILLVLLLLLCRRRTSKGRLSMVLSPRSPLREGQSRSMYRVSGDISDARISDAARIVAPFTENMTLTGLSNITEKCYYGLPSPSLTQVHDTINRNSSFNVSASVTGSSSYPPSSTAIYSSHITDTATDKAQAAHSTVGLLSTSNPSEPDEIENIRTLKDILSYFNSAVMAHGEVDPRVTQLQNRVSELAWRDTANDGETGLQRRDTLLAGVPPPYEPRSS